MSQDKGANVQVWAWWGSANQQWKVEDVGGGYAALRAMHSGQCLDVQDGNFVDGTTVRQYSCNGRSAQKWKIVSTGADTYKLLSAVDKRLALDVEHSDKQNGANVQIHNDNGSGAQRWTLTRLDGGGETPAPQPTPGAGLRTLYVAKTGNANSSGTAAQPFLTIQKAVDMAQPGDVILVGDGEYRQGVWFERQGRADAWIALRAQNKQRAKIIAPGDKSGVFLSSTARYVEVSGFDISTGGPGRHFGLGP